MVEIYAHMYVNEKMRPVETIPGMEGGGTKENDGRVEFNYCKTFVNVTMYPWYNNTKNKFNK
jgi:hypothetical protein